MKQQHFILATQSGQPIFRVECLPFEDLETALFRWAKETYLGSHTVIEFERDELTRAALSVQTKMATHRFTASLMDGPVPIR